MFAKPLKPKKVRERAADFIKWLNKQRGVSSHLLDLDFICGEREEAEQIVEDLRRKTERAE